MNTTATPRSVLRRIAPWLAIAAAIAGVALAAAFHRQWLPRVKQLAATFRGQAKAGADEDAHHHDAGHKESHSVKLSPQAWKNIDLKVGPIVLTDFEKTVTVPAIVVERPGQSTIQVAAPLTGAVTGVFVTKGQAVEPGDLLFNLRLTHEDLVQTQTEFLKTLEAVDVENREIARLEAVAEGAVARRTILERQYEKQKLEALLRAQREGLLLHSLSDAQVQQIEQDRKLLRELAIRAPIVENHAEEQHLLDALSGAHVAPAEFTEESPHSDHPLVVQNLSVHQGDVVQAGTPLGSLVDLKVLFIEGHSFEQDAEEVTRAANKNWPVTATFEERLVNAGPAPGLSIVYLANEVEPDTRAFLFYVALPNEIVRDVVGPGGRRFVSWKFKPGQRTNLLVPVERWKNAIVLPVDAIAEEGPEAYVFVRNGASFDRRPVHVEYRGQRHVVLENDGSVFPGEHVAQSSAHQLQMALKNAAAGPVDPHAGHNH